MPKFPSASDVITFDINTGGNSAGNGGDGYNKGTLTNVQNASFEPSNKADGGGVKGEGLSDLSFVSLCVTDVNDRRTSCQLSSILTGGP